MKPWLLVDTSYLAHRARYALDGLEWEDYPTGVIFGFFEQLRTICQDDRIQSNKVVFLFDSQKSYRKQDFPEYKKKRGEDLTEDERKQLGIMRDQVQLLYKIILPGMGFQVHRQTGAESDDLMAMASQQFSGPERQAIIITADGDLWQCIDGAVHWYDPARRNYYDPETFLRKKGIETWQWGRVKALTGCVSDGVPGIPGVGEKSAIQYLTGVLSTKYKRFRAIVSPEGRAIFERNKGLVLLPHRKTKPFTLRKPEYNIEAFFGFCERYGLLSYLKEPRKSEWRAFLGSSKIRTRTRTRKRGELM